MSILIDEAMLLAHLSVPTLLARLKAYMVEDLASYTDQGCNAAVDLKVQLATVDLLLSAAKPAERLLSTPATEPTMPAVKFDSYLVLTLMYGLTGAYGLARHGIHLRGFDPKAIHGLNDVQLLDMVMPALYDSFSRQFGYGDDQPHAEDFLEGCTSEAKQAIHERAMEAALAFVPNEDRKPENSGCVELAEFLRPGKKKRR